MSFTSGPWRQCNCAIYAESDGESIASCTQKEMHRAFADARLIAAAPDLLAALKRARETLSILKQMPINRDFLNHEIELIDEALKKAEGER